MPKYLLPCPACGSKITVDPPQAGQTLVCSGCGASVEVPGMRELGHLEQAAPVGLKARGAWGVRQGLMFLSLVVALVAVATSGYWGWNRPRDPVELAAPANLESLREKVGELKPKESMDFWQHLQKTGPRAAQTPEMMILQNQATANRIMIYSALAVAAVALLITLALWLSRPAARE